MQHAVSTKPSGTSPRATTASAVITIDVDHQLALGVPGAKIRRLWQMTAKQRIAAMRRGELSYRELAAWSSRHPDEIPIVNGDYEWLVALTPGACE